jgi:hypothetical protein
MKTTIIRLLILLPLLGGAISSRAGERFAGRFTGEGLTLQARGEQGKYTGTITLGENAFKFTGSDNGDGLAGSFTTPDGELDFRCAIKGDTVNLTTGDTHYKLTRANPLAKPKTSDSNSAKVKGFIHKEAGGFLGKFISSVASNKGHLGESATSAGFDTLASVGNEVQDAVTNSSAPEVPAAAATASAVSTKAPRPTRLAGTWTKSEQTSVAPGTKVTYAVFRPDGSMLMTVNAQTARSFDKNQPASSAQAAAPEAKDTDVHAHWSSDNASLTLAYDSGTTAQYSYEIRSGAAGSSILRLQGDDGTPVQEWTKSK